MQVLELDMLEREIKELIVATMSLEDVVPDDIDTRAPQTGTAIAVPWDSALETWPAVDTDPTLIRHYHSPGDPAAEPVR